MHLRLGRQAVSAVLLVLVARVELLHPCSVQLDITLPPALQVVRHALREAYHRQDQVYVGPALREAIPRQAFPAPIALPEATLQALDRVHVQTVVEEPILMHQRPRLDIIDASFIYYLNYIFSFYESLNMPK